MRVAGIGPSSIFTGSQPTVVWSTIRARGVRPSSAAFSADISSTAAAPSEICEAFPAVIFPSSLNADFNCESDSRLVSGRMPWSVRNVSSPTVIGTISRSKRPSSVARLASVCERTASSSSSEREISHWSAIISAPSPWPTMLCLAISSGVNAKPNSSCVFIVAANGKWPMCSTPDPIIASCTPAAIRAAEKFTACCAEPHWRSTVVPGVSIGRPACSQALRAMFSPCSPNCATQPAMTSSTSAASTPARSITSV